MTKYTALTIFPANEEVRQAMLNCQESEDKIIPDLILNENYIDNPSGNEGNALSWFDDISCNQDILLSDICNSGGVQTGSQLNRQKAVAVQRSIGRTTKESTNVKGNVPKQTGGSRKNQKIVVAGITDKEKSLSGIGSTRGEKLNKTTIASSQSNLKSTLGSTQEIGKSCDVIEKRKIPTNKNKIDHVVKALQAAAAEKQVALKQIDGRTPCIEKSQKARKTAVRNRMKKDDNDGTRAQNWPSDRDPDSLEPFEVPSFVYLQTNISGENSQNLMTRIYHCPTCGKEFKSSENYRKHIKIHTSEKPHQCKICHKSFALLPYLKKHESIHVSEKEKLQCQYCLKKYPDATRLRLHHTIVHLGEERKYQCDICSKTFKVPVALREHRKIHLEEKEYACEICKARFSTYSNLTHHYKTHTQEKPFKCTFCTKCFSRNSHLKAHFATHTGEKPFKCQVCTTSFRTVSNLKQHELLHSGERVSCDICGKSYSRPAHLMVHIARAHTKKKKCSCELCGEKFYTSSELTIHIRGHTGEQPFQCNFCPRTFVTAARRDEHSMIHMGFKPFQCDRCALDYYSHKSLKVHIKNHHKESDNDSETKINVN